MSPMIDRRRFLRGAVAGAAVTVGVPLLDVFLNDNATALASGAPLPRRFGTWFWGCGMNPPRWDPKTTGTDWEMTPELEPIAPIRDQLSIVSGFSVILAGETNQVHRTGAIGALTGGAPAKPTEIPAPTLDILISDHIGGATRFRSLEMAATANPKHTYSRRSESVVNPSEPSALGLYTRVFGDGFRDPNAAEFKPDPRVLLRQSALSVVSDDRKRLEASLGNADRARLDEYFTALRQLERQLEIQLQKPPPLEACSVPEAPKATEESLDVDVVDENHGLMAEVLALALACDQTRVFNMVYSNGASGLHMKGSKDSHHTLTHEEPRDLELGYQPKATAFVKRSMNAWTRFVQTLAKVREGDGTLLDSCLVMAFSETSDANSHSVTGLPFMIAGRAGGKVRPGVHVRGVGETTSRVGLTMQQIMGLNVARWGMRTNETAHPIGEILA